MIYPFTESAQYSMYYRVVQYVKTFYVGILEQSSLLTLKMFRGRCWDWKSSTTVTGRIGECVLCDKVSDLIVSSGSRQESRKRWIWSWLLIICKVPSWSINALYFSSSLFHIWSLCLSAGKLWASVLGESVEKIGLGPQLLLSLRKE